jgi:hypothetical protein
MKLRDITRSLEDARQIIDDVVADSFGQVFESVTPPWH